MAFSLADIRRGKVIRPPRVVVYGGPKIGKSTFAAGAPEAIFVPLEEGTDAIDVASFPLIQSFRDYQEAIRVLAEEDHGFRSVVVDSADWLEPLIWADVAERHKVGSIEAVGGGYGKGYIESASVWQTVLAGLSYLRDHRQMTPIVICHEEVRKVLPPDGESYDEAALKLNKRASALLEEWADVIGYAREKRALVKEDQGFGKSRATAKSLGRELCCGKSPAYVSGNRYGIGTVPLTWEAFSAALSAAQGGEQ
jgi:hypothetical protein